jgi:hypothetical protein
MSGLLLSLILKKPEDKLMYEKMVAPVTRREQEFMEAFGIDDGDGCLDYKEYVILMAVRMGSVPPRLVKEIQDRFQMLDRKHCGEIQYSDLILPPKGLSRKERIQNFVGSAKSMGGSFTRSISRTFDGSDPTSSDLIPIQTLSPSNSGKVLPFDGSQGDGNIVVIPGDIVSPTSKVLPLPDTVQQHASTSDDNKHDDSKLNVDKDKSLGCGASIESLEVIDLPEEKSPNRIIKMPRNDSDESMCSIMSFNGQGDADQAGVSSLSIINADDDKAICISPPSVTPSDITQKPASEEEEEEGEGEGEEECFNSQEGMLELKKTPTSSFSIPKQRKKKHTFRASMSMGSNTNDDSDAGASDKMTPRQKEFFDEQEKLRNAQLQVEKKNNMSSFLYFFHHQLLPHSGAIALW